MKLLFISFLLVSPIILASSQTEIVYESEESTRVPLIQSWNKSAEDVEINSNSDSKPKASVKGVGVGGGSASEAWRGALGKKETKSEKLLEVKVSICPSETESGVDSDEVKESWVVVPALFQAPLSAKKRERISGKFRNGLFNFTLVESRPSCVEEELRVKFNLSDAERGLKHAQLSQYPLDIQYSYYSNYFSPYGELRTDHHSYQYPPNEYCISSLTEEEIEAEVCLPPDGNPSDSNSSDKSNASDDDEGDRSGSGEERVQLTPPGGDPLATVISKCCPPGMVIELNVSRLEEVQCVESFEQEWVPYLFRAREVKDPSLGESIADYLGSRSRSLSYLQLQDGSIQPYYVHNNLHCNGSLLPFLPIQKGKVTAASVAEIRVLDTGVILARASGQHTWDRPKETWTSRRYIDPSLMCVDGLVTFGSKDVDPEMDRGYKRSPANQVILYCRQPEDDPLFTYSTVYFFIFCVTSGVLVLILFIYSLIWKSQNIHGWTAVAFVFFVLLYHVSSALLHGVTVFSQHKIILFESPPCLAIGIANLYSYIAMFTWMTALNFDLWVTISSMTPVSNRSKGAKRFRGYCAFALGIPLLVVGVAMGIEHWFGLFDERVVRPLIGRFACAVDTTAYVYYQSLPGLAIFLLNVVIAIMTIVSLCRTIKAAPNAGVSQMKGKLMSKLFVLMGFSWSFDFASWFVTGYNLTWYWAVFDVFNILQAFALFWIFVCCKEVRDALYKNYRILRCFFDCVERKNKKGEYNIQSTVQANSSTTHT